MRSLKSARAALLIATLSLSGCAATSANPKPPPCPEAGPAVANDLARLPADAAAGWDWLGRLMIHCDQIEALR